MVSACYVIYDSLIKSVKTAVAYLSQCLYELLGINVYCILNIVRSLEINNYTSLHNYNIYFHFFPAHNY